MLAFSNTWQSWKMKSQLNESIDYEEEGLVTFEANVNAMNAIWQRTIV